MDKAKVIAALAAWVRQRPGLEFWNYGDVAAYRAELRSIAKDKREAETLLRAVELRDSITGDAIVKASESAFSGRLSIKPHGDGGVKIDYCTGQYWPTEYRRAVCAVLASALWDYWRSDMPEPTYKQHGSADDLPMRTEALYDGVSAGDWLRRRALREFGRGIASRWFRWFR